jgi:hypothetical protein
VFERKLFPRRLLTMYETKVCYYTLHDERQSFHMLPKGSRPQSKAKATNGNIKAMLGVLH